MKQYIVILYSFIILFSGCASQDNNIKVFFNGEDIIKYVQEAVNGNEPSNAKLSNLYDFTTPLPSNANKILVDSIRNGSGETIYLLLIEHENPVYNRLAVYNNRLQLLLMDKSLNGYLSFLPSNAANKNIIQVGEQFISKDTLRLNRISFYSINDTSAALIFRSYTRFIRNNKEYRQNIDEITSQRIKTSIIAPAGSGISKEDVFVYNETLNSYLSSSDLFSKFVTEEVRKYPGEVKKPQIVDEKTAMESIGATSGNSDSTFNTSNFEADGFGLTLSETWKELRNVSISSYINTEVKGTRYINNSYGSSIYVIPIAKEDSAEMYISAVLDQKSEGKYKVRYGNKIESGKNFIQYFEYSCGAKKYLLILEASKYTYEKLREVYSDIISTFYMEC